MAKIIVNIPNGDYCIDENHPDCFYAHHSRGDHYCHLFRQYLVEHDYTYDNPIHNTTILIRKCKLCRDALSGNVGPLAIQIDMEDKTNDKNK